MADCWLRGLFVEVRDPLRGHTEAQELVALWCWGIAQLPGSRAEGGGSGKGGKQVGGTAVKARAASDCRGVCWFKARSKWQSQIHHNEKTHRLGTFGFGNDEELRGVCAGIQKNFLPLRSVLS